MIFFQLDRPTTLQNFTVWYEMVVWWICWHRTILMNNVRQKQYSQFPPVHDFGKPRWGVAYVPWVTNLRAIYAWVIRWHVTSMLSLAEHWHSRRALSNHVFAHSQSCDTWFFCSTLRELAVSNLGQLLFCRSITWPRCRNAYRDLWIMTIGGLKWVLHHSDYSMLQHQTLFPWRS